MGDFANIMSPLHVCDMNLILFELKMIKFHSHYERLRKFGEKLKFDLLSFTLLPATNLNHYSV